MFKRYHADTQIGQPSADEDGGDQNECLPVRQCHTVKDALKHAKENQQRQHKQKNHADRHGKNLLARFIA